MFELIVSTATKTEKTNIRRHDLLANSALTEI